MQLPLSGRTGGYGLPELLVCLAISALLLKIALPSMGDWHTRSGIEQTQNELVALLKLARQTAINQNVAVSVCGSKDGIKCGAPWSQGSIVFTDFNQDAQINDGEAVLRVRSGSTQEGDIYWRSFGNRKVLVFTPRGYTDNQSGSFTLCPANGDVAMARQVVINRSGRIRLARDSNQDGIFEDSKGKPLRC